MKLDELRNIDGAKDKLTKPPTGDTQDLDHGKGMPHDDGQLDHNPKVQDTKNKNHEQGEQAVEQLRDSIHRFLTFTRQQDSDHTHEYDQIETVAEQLLDLLDQVNFNPPPIDAQPPGAGGLNNDPASGQFVG